MGNPDLLLHRSQMCVHDICGEGRGSGPVVRERFRTGFWRPVRPSSPAISPTISTVVSQKQHFIGVVHLLGLLSLINTVGFHHFYMKRLFQIDWQMSFKIVDYHII